MFRPRSYYICFSLGLHRMYLPGSKLISLFRSLSFICLSHRPIFYIPHYGRYCRLFFLIFQPRPQIAISTCILALTADYIWILMWSRSCLVLGSAYRLTSHFCHFEAPSCIFLKIRWLLCHLIGCACVGDTVEVVWQCFCCCGVRFGYIGINVRNTMSFVLFYVKENNRIFIVSHMKYSFYIF